MSYMFSNCSFQTLELGPKFVIRPETITSKMFENCNELNEIKFVNEETAEAILPILCGSWVYDSDAKVIRKLQ